MHTARDTLNVVQASERDVICALPSVARAAEELNVIDCVGTPSRPGDLVIEVEIVGRTTLHALPLVSYRHRDFDSLRDDPGVTLTGRSRHWRGL